ncbi:unnamed protein product [Caenorhabditis sp. 36 PRJEB53466]|nr:unnamed protein product [Caenorhabditis sp. 36 PRJEB53466]
MSTASNIMKILEICLPDHHLIPSLPFAIIEEFEKDESTSLFRLISHRQLRNALDDVTIRQKVTEIIRKEPLDVFRLNFLKMDAELAMLAVKPHICGEKKNVFGVEILNTCCQLVLERKVIVRFKSLEDNDLSRALNTVLQVIDGRPRLFRVSVRESLPNGPSRKRKFEKFLEQLHKLERRSSEEHTSECYKLNEFHFPNKLGTNVYFKIDRSSCSHCKYLD